MACVYMTLMCLYSVLLGAALTYTDSDPTRKRLTIGLALFVPVFFLVTTLVALYYRLVQP